VTTTTPQDRSVRHEAVGGVIVAASAILFGVVVVFAKVALEHGMTVFSALATRYATSAAILAMVLVALRHPLLPARGERLWLLVLGAFGYAVESSFFFAALQHGTAAAVTLLFYVYPVIILLTSIAMGKGKPSWLLVASLAFAVCGAATVIIGSGGIDIQPLGILFAFGSSCTFSAYLIGAEFALHRTSPLTSAMWVCVWAAVGCGVFATVSGGVHLPSTPTQTWAVLGMGAGSAAAFVCMLSGLRRVGAVRASIVSSMEPLAAAILAFALLSETVSTATFIGGVMILAGAIGASIARPQSPAELPLAELP